MTYGSPTYTTITEDGDHVLKDGVETWEGTQSTVQIEDNQDGAVVTVGYKTPSGSFKSYPDGVLTKSGCIIKHGGSGTILMISVSGIVSNPVIIRMTT